MLRSSLWNQFNLCHWHVFVVVAEISWPLLLLLLMLLPLLYPFCIIITHRIIQQRRLTPRLLMWKLPLKCLLQVRWAANGTCSTHTAKHSTAQQVCYANSKKEKEIKKYIFIHIEGKVLPSYVYLCINMRVPGQKHFELRFRQTTFMNLLL